MIGIDMTLDDVIAHHQIARLLAEFARAMDERDWNRIAEILVDDAVADIGEGRLDGSAAIIATLRRYLDTCGPTQHLLGNLIVDVNGDEAQSRCYVSDMHLGTGEREHLTFVTLGDYHDRWRKIDGCWRMVERIKHNRAHVGSFDVFQI
jgi:ketosteroid isomerase-like protein